MRIQVVSDLHLEFHNLLPRVVEDVDVLVCAGDLAPLGTGAVRYAAKEWAEARHILYVIMDVNPNRAPWVCVGSDDLLASMRTFDTVENRGYLLVSEAE